MSIVIRPAGDADIAGVVALIGDRIGEEDAPEAQLVLEDPEYDRTRWTVAVDGDRVVSTMGTYPMLARLGVLIREVVDAGYGWAADGGVMSVVIVSV